MIQQNDQVGITFCSNFIFEVWRILLGLTA